MVWRVQTHLINEGISSPLLCYIDIIHSSTHPPSRSSTHPSISGSAQVQGHSVSRAAQTSSFIGENLQPFWLKGQMRRFVCRVCSGSTIPSPHRWLYSELFKRKAPVRRCFNGKVDGGLIAWIHVSPTKCHCQKWLFMSVISFFHITVKAELDRRDTEILL